MNFSLDKIFEICHNIKIRKKYNCGFYYGTECKYENKERGKECPFLLPYEVLPEDKKKEVEEFVKEFVEELRLNGFIISSSNQK